MSVHHATPGKTSFGSARTGSYKRVAQQWHTDPRIRTLTAQLEKLRGRREPEALIEKHRLRTAIMDARAARKYELTLASARPLSCGSVVQVRTGRRLWMLTAKLDELRGRRDPEALIQKRRVRSAIKETKAEQRFRRTLSTLMKCVIPQETARLGSIAEQLMALNLRIHNGAKRDGAERLVRTQFPSPFGAVLAKEAGKWEKPFSPSQNSDILCAMKQPVHSGPFAEDYARAISREQEEELKAERRVASLTGMLKELGVRTDSEALTEKYHYRLEEELERIEIIRKLQHHFQKLMVRRAFLDVRLEHLEELIAAARADEQAREQSPAAHPDASPPEQDPAPLAPA